jgi:G3E family GTPase
MSGCSVIGGYLGAGKTTLVNHVLRSAGTVRIAVVVNDFGDLGIDAELVSFRDGDVVSLVNGCICCSLSDGLASTLADLRERSDEIDHVVIEASGVSDPVRIADMAAAFGFERQGTIVLVDAERVRALAADRFVGDAVVAQIRSADLLVLTKCDLVDDTAELRTWLSGVAHATPIVEASGGRVPLDVALGPTVSDHRAEVTDHPAYVCETIRWDALARDVVVARIAAMPDTVLRAKGFVALADDLGTRHLLQLAGRRWSLTPAGRWDGEPTTAITTISISEEVKAQ